MRLVGELLGLVVFDPGKDDLEQHGELVAALTVGADLDATAHRGIRQLDLVAAGNGVQRAVEARSFTYDSQLLFRAGMASESTIEALSEG